MEEICEENLSARERNRRKRQAKLESGHARGGSAAKNGRPVKPEVKVEENGAPLTESQLDAINSSPVHPPGPSGWEVGTRPYSKDIPRLSNDS